MALYTVVATPHGTVLATLHSTVKALLLYSLFCTGYLHDSVHCTGYTAQLNSVQSALHVQHSVQITVCARCNRKLCSRPTHRVLDTSGDCSRPTHRVQDTTGVSAAGIHIVYRIQQETLQQAYTVFTHRVQDATGDSAVGLHTVSRIQQETLQ